MSFVAVLITSAARYLRGEGSASPVKPVNSSTVHPPHPVLAKARLARLIKESITMQKFVRSPLAAAAALTAAEVDAIDAAFTHAEVQRAAGRLHLKRQRLLEAAGYRSAIAEALNRFDSADVNPAQVVVVLGLLADEADEEIATLREDHAAHDCVHRARRDRHWPLQLAVSKRLTQLVAERAQILNAADAEKRAATMGLPNSNRFAVLQGAGLSDAQIAAIEPAAVSPGMQAERRRIRVAEVDRQTSLLRQFSADPLHDAAPLAGLGFDVLIDARNPTEVAA